jgi:alginate O-acetyltransferase complex protein AlgI
MILPFVVPKRTVSIWACLTVILRMITKTIIGTVCVLCLWLLASRLKHVRVRQAALLAASYVFYASWGLWFLPVLVMSSLANYWLGGFLRAKPSQGRLWLGLGANLLLLGFFKYMPQVAQVFPASSWTNRLGHLALPLGISFWTFQAMSYLFDLYREKEIDPSLLEFCLYMAFFPTIVSGPICRVGELLPQFRSAVILNWIDFADGVKRVSLGLVMMFSAFVLGNGLRAGTGLNSAFNQSVSKWSCTDAWCLAIGYGFLLFFDFAGYSHIVIGIARLFGIELRENFDRPYLSTSISSFWTRWHMSLSFWIRDYVFMPLATSYSATWWRHFSLFLAMLVFGLWHGAKWTFLLWGAFHGVLLVLHRLWQEVRRRLGFEWTGFGFAFVSWIVTFMSVSAGWVLFRADSLRQAISLLQSLAFFGSLHRTSSLPRSLYVLVFASVLGYFAVLGMSKLLDGVGERETGRASRQAGSFWELLSRERWVWATPLALVIALYLRLLMQTQQTVAAPLLYRLF